MNKRRAAIVAACVLPLGAAVAACGPPAASGIQGCPDTGGDRVVLVTVSTHNPCPPNGWIVEDPRLGGQGSQNFPCGDGLVSKAEDDGCVSFMQPFLVDPPRDNRVGWVVMVVGPLWMTTPESTGITPVEG